MWTHVLLIDRDSHSRQRAATVLAGHGYEVAEAPGGVIGLRMADAHPRDLIVLEVDMPGMDGYEVCRAPHKGWRTKQIPVVMLTAATDGTLNPEAGELGLQAWVPKSVLREGPFAVIEAALARPHPKARTAG